MNNRSSIVLGCIIFSTIISILFFSVGYMFGGIINLIAAAINAYIYYSITRN